MLSSWVSLLRMDGGVTHFDTQIWDLLKYSSTPPYLIVPDLICVQHNSVIFFLPVFLS